MSFYSQIRADVMADGSVSPAKVQTGQSFAFGAVVVDPGGSFDIDSNGDYPIFRIDGSGTFTWGDGFAQGDTVLYRTASNTLKTDDDFHARDITAREGTSFQVRIGENSGFPAIQLGAGGPRILVNTGVVVHDTNTRIAADLQVDGASNLNGNVRLGDATTDLVGFYGDSGSVQASAIPDASGGATVDAEARAAINALLAALRTTTGVALIAG
jgi:hypothetical protein